MRVILAGFGNVGAKVAEMLWPDRLVGVSDSGGAVYCEDGMDVAMLEEIKRRHGTVAAYPAERLSSTEDLLEREADVFVEATPTRLDSDEALLSMVRAMSAGMHVVTSNKAPIAKHFHELEAMSERRGVRILYSATVGGGTRVLSMARELAAGAGLEAFCGVLNGTCNYVLTEMESGVSMNTAMRKARDLGLAEADPGYDIDGIDSALKLQIVAQSAMGMERKEVDIRGIRDVSERDVSLARDKGCSLKLVGTIENGSLSVAPRAIPRGHPLDVSGSDNAFLFRTKLAGDVTVRGTGAGGAATASSIIADIRYAFRI